MPNGSVQTLVRAFAILEAVGGAPQGIRLCDIARAVELHSSTALRLLRTMAKLGYVARTDDGMWHREASNHGRNPA